MVLPNPIKTYEQLTQFKTAILIFYLYYFHNQDQREPHLVSIIQELAKHNIKTDIIVMDFAKAFDKLLHKRRLSKLNYYGIEYNTLK